MTTNRKRALFQFSLRTLLAMMLVCALIVGYMSVELHRVKAEWQLEQDAAARLRQLDGYIRLESQARGPTWLRKLSPKPYQRFFERVTAIRIYDSQQFGDADLEELRVFEFLEDLRIARTGVNDQTAIAFFKSIPHICRKSRERILAALNEKKLSGRGSVSVFQSPDLIDFLDELYGAEFLRLEDDRGSQELLVIFDSALSLKDNFSVDLGKELDYRID